MCTLELLEECNVYYIIYLYVFQQALINEELVKLNLISLL
jgi:hypothetical protein